MGQLIYMFASYAARHKDGVTSLPGMRLLADTLHPYGVKITWIVGPESARIAAGELTQWHESFGDDIAIRTPEGPATFEEKKRRVLACRDAVEKALPWASLTVAAAGHQDPEIAAVLEDTGFEGLWGFCWEQIEVDDITDRGCPWGFYYMDRGQRLRPAGGRGVIGMEWTARDLLKSFHSGNPCIYSTDPNDVARSGLCSWEQIDYLKAMADNYHRNTRYNEHVFLLQHQEAHEMERTELSQCYTEEDVREAAVMLDGFARHIKDSVRMMTLPEAAAFYRNQYSATPSSYMLWEDTAIPHHNPDYGWGTPVGPWPKTFLFYDRAAQMMFIEGKAEPVCIRNYARPLVPSGYFEEPKIPRLRLHRDAKLSWRRELEFTIESPCDMPYGVAIWGDYSLYQIAEAAGMIEGKILPRELLFLRYDVHTGENRFVVKLQGK